MEPIKNEVQDSLERTIINFLQPLYINKIFILKSVGICFIIGLIIAISLPSKYKVEVKLSPESGQSNNNLTGMANMLGLGNLSNAGQDAINSTMFPDIIKTTPYILDLYNIKVKPQNKNNEITLSEYISLQKKPWWNYILSAPNFLFNLFSNHNNNANNYSTIDPFHLTIEQKSKIEAIKSALAADVDSKSSMTIVSATFQDPVVAATVADSAVSQLQKYIINYKTYKAQDDCNYLEKLCKERKKEYYTAQQAYANFMDLNRNVILQKTQAEGERLQNEMNIAFQIYSQVETQLQMARAKVQEAKPAFAIVEPATIPLYPTSPNKKIIIIGMMLLGFIGSSAWILMGYDLWKNIRNYTNN